MTVYAYAVLQFKANKLKPETEYKFYPSRKWRADFAFVKNWTLVEAEGAVWVKGRHTSGKGYINDCEKYNHATMMGWKVLRAATTQQVDEIIEYIKDSVK
jgi:very-short-patch-repair endonuclease